jgi:hypothetical protein
VSCDDDCPTCPPPPAEVVSDYDVVLAGLSYTIYVYNTREMSVVDSMYMPELDDVYGMAVSGDGRHLLISNGTWDWGGTMIYDLKMKDTVKILEETGWIKVSNTGQYIVISGPARTYLLDGYTFESIATIDYPLDRGEFILDDSKLYVLIGGVIGIYDTERWTLDTAFRYVDNEGQQPVVLDIQPDAMGTKLYLTCGYPSYDYFEDYYLKALSLETESTTFSYHVTYPMDADFGLTPDGRQVLFSDPGDLHIDAFGSMHVLFIDPDTDAIIAIVDAGRCVQGVPQMGMMPGRFAITPDSRYTIVASASGWWAFGMIDNQQHRFVDVNVYEPGTASFIGAFCQKQQK